MRQPRQIAIAIAILALAAAAVGAPSAHAADGITKGTIYEDAPDNRYLLGGDWLFRLDNEGVGLSQRFQRQTSTDGWTTTAVPNAWNAGDNSVASMLGTVGWYRKDFALPDKRSRMDWLVRFESVNYRSTVWLNGRPLGRNAGAYLPFELRLPAGALKRRGTNRLVIRVDNRRQASDLPPAGETVAGDPSGGWWNYGGLLREVYLERIDQIAVTNVVVRPSLGCRTCSATVEMRATVRNHASRRRSVSISGRFGARSVRLGRRTVGAGDSATFRAAITIPKPQLWEPGSPNLYRASVRVRTGDRQVVAHNLHSGIRAITIARGELYLNYRKLSFRGVGLHEDDLVKGFAIDSARRRQIIAQAQELGATIIRAHYPLHPEMHELADRTGLLVWSEIPVYALKTSVLKRIEVRRKAVRMLEHNVRTNQNHPSILLWSLGNELSARPGPVQAQYIRSAVRAAKEIDPTRPTGIAVAGYPLAGCRDEYGPLDLVGVGEYFGWYPGPNGQIADRDALGDFLDSLRACYPNKAIAVDEFGAEANRDGPIEEKGTFQHQQDFVNYHLSVHDSKPWLAGSIYWTLQEFRVRPNWDGGNPRPNSPIHEKGLLRFDGSKKPAWLDVNRLYKAVSPLASGR